MAVKKSAKNSRPRKPAKKFDPVKKTVTVHADVSQSDGGPVKRLIQVYDFSDTPEESLYCKAQQTETINCANKIRAHWEDYKDGQTVHYNVKSGGIGRRLSEREVAIRAIATLDGVHFTKVSDTDPRIATLMKLGS